MQPAHIAGAVACDQQVAISGRDVHVAWEDVLSVLGLTHGHSRNVIHTPGKGTTKRLGDVLGDHHAWRSSRQAYQDPFDGLCTTGGGPQGHDTLGGLEMAL